jgi:hypothetical protein
MIKQRFIKVMAGAVAMGALMFAAPAVTQAANITSVSVTIGGQTWCDITGSCANKIWDLGAGGVDLTGGRALVLTQGQLSRANYNFDTSEDLGNNIPVITINGIVFNDTGMVLNNHGNDPETGTHQEAVDWASLGTTGGISLWVGYADNAHGGTTGAGPQQCTDANHSCLPEDPWDSSPNTTFLGNPVAGGCINPGTATLNPSLSCYDAGALRIELAPVRTPEPSVLLSLGTGLIGIAMVLRKTLQNRA